jgi:predicted dehydrogenase/threonine dehydrogenase-like Zn-dependent dehydrogenase
VLVKNGAVFVEEVPAPVVLDGMVLVQVAYSCISAGTEIPIVSGSGESLLKRTLDQPGKLKNVWNMVRANGIVDTVESIKTKLSAPFQLGYSCSGIVIDTGKNISDIKIGDRVACAGGGYACHAEVVNVPRNLIASIPENVELDLAATTTVGAIALQGVRRANPTLGETFVIIGLGILGQITAQLLRANGCRVLGIDIDLERVKLAKSLGMDIGIDSLDDTTVKKIIQITSGFGADGVIITAATDSDILVSNAFKMCRKKGRVVLVGDVGLNLNREDFYKKEIDFLISTSYGPGRYETGYEEKGLDYPIGYVRWTENRNLQAYLHLIANDRINIKPLVEEVFEIQNAVNAYASLKGEGRKPVVILLSYPQGKEQIERKIVNPFCKPDSLVSKEKIGIAIVGCGSFAKAVHLPNLKRLSHFYKIEAIQNRTGAYAKATAQQSGARFATTDFGDIFDDKRVTAVLIATRHNLHVGLALKALEAGKHVFVEKPLALSQEELDKITDFYQRQSESKPAPVLLTGFNRRFSIYACKIKELIRHRLSPLIINYVMNAGYIPLDHWVHTEEGGGRNLGEACHIYDLFTFFTDSKVDKIQACSINPVNCFYANNDNFTTTIRFQDGSLANLTYTALGNINYPKERMEIFCEGKVFLLDDYKSLTVTGAKREFFKSKTPQKGHKEELEAFANTILLGGDWPIPLWQQVQATEIGLQIEELIKKG